MTQAITVKFLGPTNVRGSRYKATCQAGSLTLGSDHSLNPSQNARRVAQMLCVKLAWPNAESLIEGGLPNGDYVFVFPRPEIRALEEALRSLIDAATSVAANWERGDLAGAVNVLQAEAEAAAAILTG